MIRSLIFTLTLAFAASSTYAAGITLTASDPVIADGLQSFDVFLSSEAGVTIEAIDLSFTGNLNQEQEALATSPFNDGNAIIGALGGNADLDSQFSFASTDLILAPGESVASATELTGVFTFNVFPAAGSTFQIAQLTIPEGETVAFDGAISNSAGPAVALSGVLPAAVGPTVVFDPISGTQIDLSFDEPSSVIGITGGETELVDLQDPTGIFSVVDNGTSVEVSLNEAFDFSTIAPGTLSTATLSITAGGETATFDIATNAPEPTSIALIGLGLAGVVARRRRV